MPLIGWVSLEKTDKVLYNNLIEKKGSTNSIRNKIMHGDAKLDREKASEHIEVIIGVLAWLSQNPFGVDFGPKPVVSRANSFFVIFDKEGLQVSPKPNNKREEQKEDTKLNQDK
jgi:hypothetical protein